MPIVKRYFQELHSSQLKSAPVMASVRRRSRSRREQGGKAPDGASRGKFLPRIYRENIFYFIDVPVKL